MRPRELRRKRQQRTGPAEVLGWHVKPMIEAFSRGEASTIEHQIKQLQQCVTPNHTLFQQFQETISADNPTGKFWVQFVCRDALAYIGLYLAIRGGNWNLRMACLKLMAPVFSAFDHFTYNKLIAQHIADVVALPEDVKSLFEKGGFVVSIKGRPWSSVAIDEAHEMQINRACKTAIVHPSKDYLSRIAAYLPYRTRCIEILKEQLFPQENTVVSTHDQLSFQGRECNDKKTQHNVHASCQ